MAAKAIQVERLNQIVRLKSDGFSTSAIARLIGISRPTVIKYLLRLQAQTQEPAALSEEQLSAVYNHDNAPHKGDRYNKLLEHFGYAEKELKRTGVTRQLLWIEYRDLYADGYNYSQYCYHFQEYVKNKEVVMHLEHTAAEKIMMDFAGKKLGYTDPYSGEVVLCQVFVSVLPHSGLLFCYAVHTQSTSDFVTCINEMLFYYGGVPLTILCDNLKTAVTRPCRYEPVFTDVCYQLSEHYQTTFSATRPYHPRDKAMVERAVSICYTHIYAPLRGEVFTSLHQLNRAIKEKLDLLNQKPYKGSAYSRRDLFEQSEKALLKPLPSTAFTAKKVVQATVQRNYHIQLSEDHHYYSVPYRYAGKKVRVLYDNKTLEIYLEQERIAVHSRSGMGSTYHTTPEHMPSHHQRALNIKGWTRGDLLAQAHEIGPSTHKAIEYILCSSFYPEQNFKSAHGVLVLAKSFGRDRVEAACTRVLTGTRVNYTLIKNILSAGLDRKPLSAEEIIPLPLHDNIRGADHYQ
jgi:transposase